MKLTYISLGLLFGAVLTVRDCFLCRKRYSNKSSEFTRYISYTLVASVVSCMGSLLAFSSIVYAVTGVQILGLNGDFIQVPTTIGSSMMLLFSLDAVYKIVKGKLINP